MNPRERGWLLLCAELGTGEKPLTLAQVRQLRQRVLASDPPRDPLRELSAEDLRALGYDAAQAEHIAALFAREAALDAYLKAGRYHAIEPITPSSDAYPARLRQTLGEKAPPVLFCRGDMSLLQKSCVSLTGSRRLNENGAAFAKKIGQMAAREGYVLVSGNAQGADSAAQQACLDAGGSVISVLADSPADHEPEAKQLLVCEEGWHLPFSAPRARSRNRIIYALGQSCFVAQTDRGVGGTWHGAVEALQLGLMLYVHDDGSDGAKALEALGAEPLRLDRLRELSTLSPSQMFFS